MMKQERAAKAGGSHRWRGAFVAALIVFLFLMAAQLPLLIEFVAPPSWSRRPSVNVIGPAAAKFQWPAMTPHEQAWPAITQYAAENGFARNRQVAWSLETVAGGGQRTHQMEHHTFGWPLPALYHTLLWWPSGHLWASRAPQDTGLRISWAGLILNPLLFVSAGMVMILVPLRVKRVVIERKRRRLWCCAACGYPIGVSPVCTECGAAVRNASNSE